MLQNCYNFLGELDIHVVSLAFTVLKYIYFTCINDIYICISVTSLCINNTVYTKHPDCHVPVGL